jgi:hypothetical protein
MPNSIHQVKAHTNIKRNGIVDELAKLGTCKPDHLLRKSHEFVHSTLYYLHKDKWLGMQ